MQLEEMRMARKMAEADAQKSKDASPELCDLQAALEQAKQKFTVLLEEVDQDLRDQWKAWDSGESAARKAAQKAMVALLDRRRYLSNLVRDVTETLGA